MKKVIELKRALAEARTPDAVRAVLYDWEGKIEIALPIVAAEARAFDESLELAIFTSNCGASELFANPARLAGVERRAATWCANWLTGEAKDDRLYPAAHTLRCAFETGEIPENDPAYQKTLDLVWTVQQSSKRHWLALSTAVANPCVSEAVLEQLEQRAAFEKNWMALARLAANPAASEALMRRIVQTHFAERRVIDPYLVLINSPRVRRDPIARSVLLRLDTTRQHDVYLAMFVKDVLPGDFVRLFHSWVRLNATAAQQFLEEEAARVLSILSPEDVASLLCSESRDVRLAALTSLSKLQPGEANAVTPESSVTNTTGDVAFRCSPAAR